MDSSPAFNINKSTNVKQNFHPCCFFNGVEKVEIMVGSEIMFT